MLQRGDVTTVRTHVVPSWRTHGPREEKGSGRPLASPYGNYRGAGACRGLRFPAPAVPRGNLSRRLSAASTAKINTRRSHEVTGPGPARRSSAATRGAASGSPRGCPAMRAAGAGLPRERRRRRIPVAGQGRALVKSGAAFLRAPVLQPSASTGHRRRRFRPPPLTEGLRQLPAGSRPAAGRRAFKATRAPLGPWL